MSLQLRITGNDGVTNLGLAKITAPEKYTIRDGGKVGKCIRFDSSDNIVYLNMDVTDFTVTYWHKESVDNVPQSDLSYGDSTSNVDRVLTKTSTEWTFSYIRNSSKTLHNMHITMGESEYCDIRVYDHILSEYELTLIKRCLIFEHQLGRPQSSIAYKADSKYGLQDTSGFGHDLSVNGTVVNSNWVAASPVGQGFLNFNKSFYLTFDAFGSSLESPDITISFYAFRENWKSDEGGEYTILQMGNDSPSICIKFYNNAINVSITTSSGTNAYSADISKITSGWHMFTITRSSHDVSIYVDRDVLKHSDVSNAETILLDSGIIGKLFNIPSYNGIDVIILGLCDMRIYSSYMTADDVAMLYDSRIAIDSSGNLYAYSNSRNTTELGFGSNGDIKGEIKETLGTFKMYSDRLECRSFYEI